MSFRDPRTEEIPEALRPRHAPCETVDEALLVLGEAGAADDARAYLAGEAGRSPGWAVRTPRQQSALAVLTRHRTPPAAPPEPKLELSVPSPERVRTYEALMALPLGIKSEFYRLHPGHVAALKSQRSASFHGDGPRGTGEPILPSGRDPRSAA